MQYRTIGTDPATRREVSVIALGAMLFGTLTDERTSFALLDHYVEAGGTFIDTADCYAFWLPGARGHESEELLGRWRRSRGIGDEVTLATKLGAQPLTPGAGLEDAEGLSAKAIRIAIDRSRERLAMDKLDMLYTHLEDEATPLDETVEALGAAVAEGAVGLLGVSNHAVWKVERSRTLAAAAGLAGYEVMQYRHSYLPPRGDVPLAHMNPVTKPEHLNYLRENREMALVAYSPLLAGAYVRKDKPLAPEYDHPGTPPRLAVLREVARETGATPNQVVLAWLLGAEVPVIPLVGASSIAQLDESLAALDLELSAEQRARLDAAH